MTDTREHLKESVGLIVCGLCVSGAIVFGAYLVSKEVKRASSRMTHSMHEARIGRDDSEVGGEGKLEMVRQSLVEQVESGQDKYLSKTPKD